MERQVIALPEIEALEESFETLPLLSGAFESFHKGWGADTRCVITRRTTTRDSSTGRPQQKPGS